MTRGYDDKRVHSAEVHCRLSKRLIAIPGICL